MANGSWHCVMAVLPGSTVRHLVVACFAVVATIGHDVEWRLTFPTGRDVWEPTQRAPAWASPRSAHLDGGDSQAAVGIMAQTPANTMQLGTIACIVAINAVGNYGQHHQWQRCEERLRTTRKASQMEPAEINGGSG